MPRNSSGVYTLPLPPVVPGTTITSTWANTTLDDVTAGLTDSLDRYGRGGMVAPFRLIDGTEALPAFAFNAETGSGLYRESTGVVAMSVLGTARQEWTAAGIVFLSPVAFAGNATVNGDLEVTGDILADGNLGTLGNLAAVGTLGVGGGSALAGSLTVQGPVGFNSTLDVAGLASLHGGAAITGTLTVGGSPVTPGAYVLKAGDTMTGPLTINSPAALALTVNSTIAGGGYTGWQSSGSSQGFVGSAPALATGWPGESPSATELAVRGQSGIWFDVSSAPVAHINAAGQMGLGGMPQNYGLTIRNDLSSLGTGAGGTLTLSNKVVTASSHVFGSVLFDAFRDVASPSYVAGMWAQGTSPAGNTVDLIFGATVNGGTGFPAERMRITQAGIVAIGLNGGAPVLASTLEILGSSNAIVLRQASSTGYTGFRIYNDIGSPARALEIDYTGSAYAAGGEQANIYVTGAFPLILGTNNAERLRITGAGVIQDAAGLELGWRRLPASAVTSGDVSPVDVGRTVWATGNINIPNSMAVTRGDAITIMNDTNANITITPTGGMTMYQAGAAGTIGARTLAGRGIATVVFGNNTYSVASGQGLS